MNTKKHKWLSFVLTALMALTLIPTPVVMAGAGDVTLQKTATPVSGMVNTWDIKLRIEAEDTESTADVVLLIDRSGSMDVTGSGGKTRMENAKDAAKNLVDSLLTSSGGRISLVSFAGVIDNDITKAPDITVHQPLTTNATLLKGSISGMTADGGTFTQAALRQAVAQLTGSTADAKHIILLSDGEPTYSHEIKSPYKTNTANLVSYSPNGWQTATSTPQNQFNYGTNVGSGGSMWARYEGDWWNPKPSDKYYNHGHSAVAEAGFYKDTANKKYLHTVAL
ncbi:MAG TPA: vWA domain-containing protein, partial [Clostridia bacterium]|nr:vWA domain-containing protein [Clostridia bacterium]